MSKFIIEGGAKLKGKVNISGFKNATLAIIPSTILCKDKCIIENIPMIEDVKVYKEILYSIGAEIEMIDENSMMVDTSNISEINILNELPRKIRGSYYMWGVGLGRFKHVSMPLPGGCAIGDRPFDYHIKGFEALGAKVVIGDDKITLDADRLIGAKIYLDFASVGATINIMMCAVYAEGITTIENAAKEPHIVDTANFLNAMGADIKGAGTDIIRINGVTELKGCTYGVIPDQIEAGTYMIAAAATQGDIIIDGIIPKHLEPITAKLIEMGMGIEEYGDSLRVYYKQKLVPVNVKTLPYPGFPTDLQQPMAVLLSSIEGNSIIEESIYEDRFKYIQELKKMGADIEVNGRIAHIKGKEHLCGSTVKAMDLRAGAALIVAGLVSKGITEITDIHHMDRGYENIENKFMNLGANIKRIKD
ncbi:UDP-N-acetylglucosamine 1-carboxyvinyltransferase [Sedimentibacter sp. zth1]|uniref:UDP-N-acetylglucosamine 1-carboxyvinyltransferase n=1 Tax=Sedimentibacter sp. zth1 TaxID=2816908 RepID=UPI001A923688|nr:UDP-N-acetylglucosamine 1-carboxyvinyltransferase [Sedimentibacter sp. zth1]QSX05022.1 UDP-N-acetylglucosamine 1-carboxyvinyltransferase [Sedimentibacter sp. zth1]